MYLFAVIPLFLLLVNYLGLQPSPLSPHPSLFLVPKLSLETSNQEMVSLVAQPSTLCSDQTLETLTTQLLRDLLSYANRVTQRARNLKRAVDVYSYVLVAGKPEFAPLPLNPSGFSSDELTTSEGVEQVFFTTLERQYISRKAVQLQLFHWLFLTKTTNGWRVVMMFSQTGYYSANKPPTPPRDSTNGVVAQAVNLWLRDCQARKLPIPPAQK